MTDLASSAPHIHEATTYDDLVDWGPQPDMIKGQSHSTGRLLHKGPDNSPETGIWVCTPGTWRISVPRDEFCHFVAGRVIYRRDGSDEVACEPRAAASGRANPGEANREGRDVGVAGRLVNHSRVARVDMHGAIDVNRRRAPGRRDAA